MKKIGIGIVMLFLAFFVVSAQSGFQRIEGSARTIGIGANGSVWIVGKDNALYNRQGNTWKMVGGFPNAARVAVSAQGNPVVLTSTGQILMFVNGRFEDAGSGLDIAIGANNHFFRVTRDGRISQWNGSGWGPGFGNDATRIAVDPAGNVWTISPQRAIARYNGTTKQNLPGSAISLTISAKGSVYMIGDDVRTISEWTGTNWKKVMEFGEAAQMAADPQNKFWVLSTNFAISTNGNSNITVSQSSNNPNQNPSSTPNTNINTPVAPNPSTNQATANSPTFQTIEGLATAISINSQGAVWVVGTDKNLYRRTGNTWQQVVVPNAKRIAVSGDGEVAVLLENSTMQIYLGDKSQNIPGQALDIAVGANGDFYHIGLSGTLYKWNASNQNWGPSFGNDAAQLAVDPQGNPWTLSKTGVIARYNGTNKQIIEGQAFSITVSARGSVFVLGSDYKTIYRWTGSGWKVVAEYPNAAVIAADPQDRMWVLGKNSAIGFIDSIEIK